MPKLVGLLLLAISLDASASAQSRYETVNRLPQLGADDSAFSFYWAVWRGLGADEGALLRAQGGGSLVSERRVTWQTRDCLSDRVLHADGERLWYLDSIRFDRLGQIIPIPEAPRAGYRYLDMMTLNGIFLRGTGPFPKPARRPGESHSAYREREGKLYDEWFAREATPRGARGWAEVRAIHRLFGLEFPTDGFIPMSSYLSPDSALYALFSRMQPDRWPVYYDERAHKPHRMDEPPQWAKLPPLREDRFRLRLEWNWCSPGGALVARAIVPTANLPGPGPTRPGRTDAGTLPLEIVEDPNFLP